MTRTTRAPNFDFFTNFIHEWPQIVIFHIKISQLSIFSGSSVKSRTRRSSFNNYAEFTLQIYDENWKTKAVVWRSVEKLSFRCLECFLSTLNGKKACKFTYKCFPVNFLKIFRAAIFTDTTELLSIIKKLFNCINSEISREDFQIHLLLYIPVSLDKPDYIFYNMRIKIALHIFSPLP